MKRDRKHSDRPAATAAAPAAYLFEEENGLPVPRPAGTRRPDGRRFFDLAGAARHFNASSAALAEIWEATAGRQDAGDMAAAVPITPELEAALLAASEAIEALQRFVNGVRAAVAAAPAPAVPGPGLGQEQGKGRGR